MSRLAVCPQRHVWSPDGAEAAAANPVCPVCGQPGTDAVLLPTGTFRDFETLAPAVVPPVVSDVTHIVPPAVLAGMRDEAEDVPQVPGYEILRELGRGGMGVVYLARHRELKRLVALKMILGGAHRDVETRTRFRREAEAVARLQHPGIVQIHDVGEFEGRPYCALEYIDGTSLAARIAGTPVPPRVAAGLIEALARAAAFAHSRGIVHRDLTPRNVLLARGNSVHGLRWGDAAAESWEPKITDFGLAKELDSDVRQTQTGVIMGTPSYMSPEQAQGNVQQIGPATDVHALGGILYELLTGRPPFLAETQMETLRQVIDQDPVPPSRLQRRVPRDLETICLKCLAKDPKRRYATAEALADDLHRFLQNEPIAARPVSLYERAGKWARRHPAATGLLAVSMLAIVTLLVGSLVYSARVRGERNRAEKNFALAMRAVEEMLTEVGEEQLATEPRMEEKRQKLLAKALALYQEFLKQKADDPRVRLETAQAWRRMADIFRLLGRHGEAIDAYQQAAVLLGRLRDESPKPVYRQQLAWCDNFRGEVLRVDKRHAEAEAAYKSAQRLLGELTGEFPANADFAQDAARTLYNLGILFRATNRPVDAEIQFHEAIERLNGLVERQTATPAVRQHLARAWLNLATVIRAPERFEEGKSACETAAALLAALTDEFPDRPDYRFEAGVASLNLGNLLARAKQLESARAAYLQAQQRLRPLAIDFPKVPVYRQELANAANGMASVLLREANHAEAVVALREALELLERLVVERSDVPAYREDLAMVLGNLGLSYHAQSRLDEARGQFEQAIERLNAILATQPDNAFCRQLLRNNHQNLAESLLGLHDHRAAAAAAGALAGVFPDAARDRYVAACFLARCIPEAEADAALSDDERRAAAERYAKASLESLREAVARGFDDAGQLAKDREQALAAIASRPEFQDLLQQIAARNGAERK